MGQLWVCVGTMVVKLSLFLFCEYCHWCFGIGEQDTAVLFHWHWHEEILFSLCLSLVENQVLQC